MFVAAGQPGDAKKIQASVAAARKVFRIMRVRCALLWRGCVGRCTVCVVCLAFGRDVAEMLFPHSTACPHPAPPLQPLEALNPLLQSPGLAGGGCPAWAELLLKLRPVLMSVYFGGDHVVWAQQVGCAGGGGARRML